MQSSSVSLLQGDYEKALKCDCLSHFEISDARRPLYKVRKPFPSYFLSSQSNKKWNSMITFSWNYWQAIIYIMSSKHARDEIIDEWKKFHDLNQAFHCEPLENESLIESQLHQLITDFDEFEKVIKVLKEDIIEAQAKRKKWEWNWKILVWDGVSTKTELDVFKIRTKWAMF